MRITPVGIATAADRLSVLVDRVQQASLVTHNTSVALAGAAAVAAAVSAGIDGADRRGRDRHGHRRRPARRRSAATGRPGRTSPPASTGPASLVAGPGRRQAAELIYTLVGTSLATQESVPAAFAVLSAVPDDPWRACLLAASLGGDCDTIAAMAGAIGGACHGLAAFPPHAVETVDAERPRPRRRWLTPSSNCENHDHPERTRATLPGRP